MTKHINTAETKQTFHPIVITINKQKTSYNYLQTATVYKKSGNITSRKITN